MIISIANKLSAPKVQSDAFMCSIMEDSNTIIASVMTPQQDLLVANSEINESAISFFIKDLIANKTNLSGIVAENAFADMFCKKWSVETGDKSKLFRRERAYELRRFNDIKSSNGQMRLAVCNDIDQMTEWVVDFCNEINEPIAVDGAKQLVETKIVNKEIFVWFDREIVSMCGVDRETQHGKAIKFVFTPPKNREKGYATSCVFHLCQRILYGGKLFCSLIADLDNQASNSIYKKIGFDPVLDLLHYKFN